VHYVSDIMKTKVTMDPEEPLHQHPELVTEFRSGIGSLQWLAGTTRGDLSSYVSLLQKKHSDLKVSDLIESTGFCAMSRPLLLRLSRLTLSLLMMRFL
jgi:hypothetical protein